MANKDLPIYKLVIDETQENSGVSYVAMVDKPAIISTWQKFSEQKPMYFQGNPERQIVTGAAMIADLPIYRNDAKFGEHYVTFDRESIEKIMMKFMANGFTKKVNLMHNAEAVPSDVFIFESFQVDSQRGIKAPEFLGDLTDGSWVISMKVSNPDVWASIDSLNGFSVEGLFDMVHVDDQAETDIVKQIKEILGDTIS